MTLSCVLVSQTASVITSEPSGEFAQDETAVILVSLEKHANAFSSPVRSTVHHDVNNEGVVSSVHAA
jgi:hypothetical protein